MEEKKELLHRVVRARIGLFGGSFNPIHQGHINMVNYAIERLKLDEVIFIPCYQSVDKGAHEYASAFHRLLMISKVLPPKCSVSLHEVNQFRPVQTIRTLAYFRELFKDADLFFLLGEDSFATIQTWQQYKEMDKYVNMVVFRRNDSRTRPIVGIKALWMSNELWDISSSSIRKGKLDGLDLRVEEYIKENNLYDFVN